MHDLKDEYERSSDKKIPKNVPEDYGPDDIPEPEVEIFEINRDIHFEISKISGKGSRYDLWSFVAEAWLENDNGDKEHEKRIKVGTKKGSGVNEDKVAHLIRDKYVNELRDDDSFDQCDDCIEDEKKKLEDLDGKKFCR